MGGSGDAALLPAHLRPEVTPEKPDLTLDFGTGTGTGSGTTATAGTTATTATATPFAGVAARYTQVVITRSAAGSGSGSADSGSSAGLVTVFVDGALAVSFRDTATCHATLPATASVAVFGAQSAGGALARLRIWPGHALRHAQVASLDRTSVPVWPMGFVYFLIIYIYIYFDFL